MNDSIELLFQQHGVRPTAVRILIWRTLSNLDVCPVRSGGAAANRGPQHAVPRPLAVREKRLAADRGRWERTAEVLSAPQPACAPIVHRVRQDRLLGT